MNEKQFSASVPNYTTQQVIEAIYGKIFRYTTSGNFIRVNPCPLSGKDSIEGVFSIPQDNPHLWKSFMPSAFRTSDFSDLIDDVGCSKSLLFHYTEGNFIRALNLMKGIEGNTILDTFHTEIEKPVLSDKEISNISNSLFDKIKTDKEALRYLKNRGISAKSIAKFKLGVNEYGQISYPYTDSEGTVKYIKYKHREKGTSALGNNSKNSFYPFNTSAVLNQSFWIVEGEHDVISLSQKGINALAIGGQPSEEKKQYIKQLIRQQVEKSNSFLDEDERLQSIPRVSLCFDNDKAGREFEQEFYELLKDLKICLSLSRFNPLYKDIDDFIQSGRYSENEMVGYEGFSPKDLERVKEPWKLENMFNVFDKKESKKK